MSPSTYSKEFLERHIVQCAVDLLEDVPIVLRHEVARRVSVFFRGIDRIPPAEFTDATFDEFREKFMRVCEAMRKDFCAPEGSYRWN
ncbi:MAG: hypothetical protein O3A81_03525 [bacterium]|nr:hypothetical protein [bacterium]